MTHKPRADRIRPVRSALAAVGVVLLAAACSPAYSTGSRASTVTATGKTQSVTLVENSWTGSTADVYIAKWVLQTQLGTTVKVIQLDEIPLWPAMAQGQLGGPQDTVEHLPHAGERIPGADA